MKMLVSKYPISNLESAQYLHATQLQVANLFEQLEHEKNLRRQQDRSIQQLQLRLRLVVIFSLVREELKAV